MNTKQGAAVLELKALADDGTFAGYGSIFGNKDSYGDVVMPGAFAKSLAEHRKRGSRPKMFWQHDAREPIGSWLDFSEDGKGLYMEGRLNMDVQRGREAHSLLKAKDIDGLSIGYNTITAEPDEKAGVLRLKEVRLIEVSVVSLGANDRALVDTVKNIRAAGLPSLVDFEGFLREAGFSKSEATAIAGKGLAPLLRGEPGSNPAADYLAAIGAHLRA